jgi:hypothetical protein
VDQYDALYKPDEQIGDGDTAVVMVISYTSSERTIVKFDELLVDL